MCTYSPQCYIRESECVADWRRSLVGGSNAPDTDWNILCYSKWPEWHRNRLSYLSRKQNSPESDRVFEWLTACTRRSHYVYFCHISDTVGDVGKKKKAFMEKKRSLCVVLGQDASSPWCVQKHWKTASSPTCLYVILKLSLGVLWWRLSRRERYVNGSHFPPRARSDNDSACKCGDRG